MSPIYEPLPGPHSLPTPTHRGDIGQQGPDGTHFHSVPQHHHNSTQLLHLPIPQTPNDYGESTLEEEVDHLLILLATLLPLLLVISIIAALAILIRRMKNGPGDTGRRSCEEGGIGEHSFSSLPTPTPTPWWREETLSMSKAGGHSVSMPHLLILPPPNHSISLPHLLAIESYYNYPSTASILEETFQDVVDQAKIQAEVALELRSDEVTPPKLKRSLSLKSLRRLRRRILRILSFRKRQRRTEEPEPNNFNLSTLPVETRQQLKQIYVY